MTKGCVLVVLCGVGCMPVSLNLTTPTLTSTTTLTTTLITTLTTTLITTLTTTTSSHFTMPEYPSVTPIHHNTCMPEPPNQLFSNLLAQAHPKTTRTSL